jgi:hypothetical protein
METKDFYYSLKQDLSALESRLNEKIIKNKSSKKNGTQTLSGLTGSSLLFAALGYYFYAGIDGFMGMLIFTGLLALACLVSLIPFAGFFVQLWITFGMIVPYVFNLTGIHHTIITWIPLTIYIILGLILCMTTTYAVVSVSK